MIAPLDLALPHDIGVLRFENDLTPPVVDRAAVSRRSCGHRLPDIVDAVVVRRKAVGGVKERAVDPNLTLRHGRTAVFIDDRLGHIEHAGTLVDVDRVGFIARPAIPEVVVMLNRTGTEVFDRDQRLKDVHDVGLDVKPGRWLGVDLDECVLRLV